MPLMPLCGREAATLAFARVLKASFRREHLLRKGSPHAAHTRESGRRDVSCRENELPLFREEDALTKKSHF